LRDEGALMKRSAVIAALLFTVAYPFAVDADSPAATQHYNIMVALHLLFAFWLLL